MAGSAAPRATGNAYDKIVETLERLEDDQTLLVQSGKPVGVFRTHKDAPRVLIANSNLVPKWANWEVFNELDRKGLMMYGQMTAGSWIYIGTQGIVQGTYETFAEMGRQHYGGDLKGSWILTAGLGGMGGAQPLAAVMAGAHCIAIEVQESRIEKRLETRYLDRRATSIDEALEIIRTASEPTSRSACSAMPPRSCRRCSSAESGPTRSPTRPARTIPPTAIARPAGASPNGRRCASAILRRSPKPREFRSRSHVEAMLAFKDMGVPTFDYGNNIRQEAKDMGVTRAFDFPGFVPAYVRPLFCRGIGPFRWVALSGDPEDIYRTDAKVKELIPDDPHLHRWLDMARERIAFQGLPARICWVGLGQRHRLGLAFNEMVQKRRSLGPDRHRPRPSRQRQRRLAQPRDRKHDGWQRRHLRLAAAQRLAQHRERRDLGIVPPRRRGRHGLFAARRDGDRRRRHRRRRAAARARAVERPRHRGHAPRRCGL